MYDVALSIYHNIAIVTVLYLQKVSDHAIRSHRLDEVATNVLELLGRLVAVLRNEVLIHVAVCSTAELVSRRSIRHTFYHSALITYECNYK